MCVFSLNYELYLLCTLLLFILTTTQIKAPVPRVCDTLTVGVIMLLSTNVQGMFHNSVRVF